MKLTLVKKENEGGNIVTFYWGADPPIKWKPGQYLYYNLTLPQTDPRGNTRHFTIASSPTEEFVQLTTRIRDESLYKQTLNTLEVGAIVDGSGPRGDFVLDEERDAPQVLLAGGIGITPFRSIIKFATDKKLPTPIHLIYSASTPEELVFKDQFDSWSKESPNFKVSYTITKPEEASGWTGLTGRINSGMIQKLLTSHFSLLTSTLWVCGPPSFVGAMQDELQKLNVVPEKIEIEQFTGY